MTVLGIPDCCKQPLIQKPNHVRGIIHEPASSTSAVQICPPIGGTHQLNFSHNSRDFCTLRERNDKTMSLRMFLTYSIFSTYHILNCHVTYFVRPKIKQDLFYPMQRRLGGDNIPSFEINFGKLDMCVPQKER